MSQVILSPKAKADLSDIWEYTFAEWGIDQAEKYVRELWAAMQEKGGDLSTSTDICKTTTQPQIGFDLGSPPAKNKKITFDNFSTETAPNWNRELWQNIWRENNG